MEAREICARRCIPHEILHGSCLAKPFRLTRSYTLSHPFSIAPTNAVAAPSWSRCVVAEAPKRCELPPVCSGRVQNDAFRGVKSGRIEKKETRGSRIREYFPSVNAGIAQLVEQLICNSALTSCALFHCVAQPCRRWYSGIHHSRCVA